MVRVGVLHIYPLPGSHDVITLWLFRFASMFRLSARTLATLSLQIPPVLQRRAASRAAPFLISYSPTYLGALKRTLTSSPGTPKRCPSCSTPLPSSLPVCPKCFYIAPIPESMTYYEMLGTPYEPNPFVVDPRHLKDQFRAAQAVVHPDRWVGKQEVPMLCEQS